MGTYLSAQLKDLTLDNVEIQEKLGEGTFGVVSSVTFKRKDGSFVEGVGKQLVGGTVSEEIGDKIRLLFRLQHGNIAGAAVWIIFRIPDCPSFTSYGAPADPFGKLPADEIVRRRRRQAAHFEQRGFCNSVSPQSTTINSARSSHVPQRSCHGD